MLADDAVALFAHGEVELHLHLVLALVDEGVVALGGVPGLAPERPGYGVDESRLAVAVVAGDAGGVDAVEVERGHVVPVGHEVAQRQLDGNHLSLL
ncbi:hypothetical protein ES703_119056 [subsurface metagenome]